METSVDKTKQVEVGHLSNFGDQSLEEWWETQKGQREIWRDSSNAISGRRTAEETLLESQRVCSWFNATV